MKMAAGLLVILLSAAQGLASGFDPAADAEGDIRDAVTVAQWTQKRIILDVGGEWCSWCHALDRFFDKHEDLRELREKHYIWVKINFSPENKNEKTLSRYPKIPGYPHFFVLETDGTLLHSQNTSLLEEGKSYDHQKMLDFLNRWAPPER